MKTGSLALGALVSAALALPGPVELEDRGEEYVFNHVDVAPVSPFAIPFDDLSAAYTDGRVHMSLMSLFTQQMNKMAVLGIFDEPVTHTPITQFTPCVNGFAGTKENNTFACAGLDLYMFQPHQALGSEKKLGSDIWWAILQCLNLSSR
jgi:hypothetical protein